MSLTDRIDSHTPAQHDAAARLSDRDFSRHPALPTPKAERPAKAPKPKPSNETVVALIASLGMAQTKLRDHGDTLWQRTVDWNRTPRIPRPSLADEQDPDTVSTLEAEERLGDALASRYQSEVAALANRLRSDLARLNQIDAIVIRAQPRALVGKELVTSQVAGAGFCVSCWRWDQTIKDRERDAKGAFYNKEACRRCSGFKSEHGVYPPVSLLEHWHAKGKNWTTAMVQTALEAEGHITAKAS